MKLKADRFAGYKSICLFGLGSLFWGSATGFLGQLKEKDEKADKAPDRSAWMDFCFLYSAFALLFMLLGVAASSFPNSSWFAPSVAGFGSLQALILVLGGFHVASLKYHSYGKETKYSMIGSTILIIIYWGLSVQDPIVSFLHRITWTGQQLFPKILLNTDTLSISDPSFCGETIFLASQLNSLCSVHGWPHGLAVWQMRLDKN